MKRTWIYFSNTFEVNTRKAFTKMLRIGNDHDSRLNGDNGDPVIDALFKFFNPLLLVYRTLYSLWQSSISARMSKTLILNTEFGKLAKPWIRDWQNKVYAIFEEDSPQDKALFPNKRAPFQTYNIEERIIAVKTLAEAMGAYPELETIKADVEAKYNQLVTVRDEQKQAMQKVAQRSDDLEAQRITLANALYQNLAKLMAKYFERPTDGERFFDLSLLRRNGGDADSLFNANLTVNAETSMVLALPKKFELSIGTNFVFANNQGGGELHCFFADTAAATDSPLKAVVLSGETVEITAAEMGWNTLQTMLIVRNAGNMTAEFEVAAMEAAGNG